jgi:hypothetical protein
MLERKREKGKQRNAAQPTLHPRHRRWFLILHSLAPALR